MADIVFNLIKTVLSQVIKPFWGGGIGCRDILNVFSTLVLAFKFNFIVSYQPFQQNNLLLFYPIDSISHCYLFRACFIILLGVFWFGATATHLNSFVTILAFFGKRWKKQVRALPAAKTQTSQHFYGHDDVEEHILSHCFWYNFAG